MRVFNLAEELEKERKKNEKLQEKIIKDNYFIGGLSREIKELQENIKIALEMCKEEQDRIDKVKKYIKETRESDSCTILPSGKITDIGYCLDALEDIEDLLNGKELKGEQI